MGWILKYSFFEEIPNLIQCGWVNYAWIQEQIKRYDI